METQISEQGDPYSFVKIKSQPAVCVEKYRQILQILGPDTRAIGRAMDVVWYDVIIAQEWESVYPEESPLRLTTKICNAQHL